MIQIGSKEIKEIEINILDWIDSICKLNNIKYFLGSGTLLGAARHKGFIPWDDDIDLYMFREDYDKFLFITSECSNNQYSVLNLNNTDDYYYSFTKVVDRRTFSQNPEFRLIKDMGVWVDIFPLDNYSNTFSFRKMKMLRMKEIINSNDKFYTSHKWYNTLPKLFIHILFHKKKNYNIYAKKVDEYAQTIKIKTDKVFIADSPVGNKDVFERIWFDDVEFLEFEGKKYPCPKEYVKLLNHRYGDYMKLPPESQRIKHDSNAFWRNTDSKK